MSLKLYAVGPTQYFNSKFNKFDFSVNPFSFVFVWMLTSGRYDTEDRVIIDSYHEINRVTVTTRPVSLWIMNDFQ